MDSTVILRERPSRKLSSSAAANSSYPRVLLQASILHASFGFTTRGEVLIILALSLDIEGAPRSVSNAGLRWRMPRRYLSFVAIGRSTNSDKTAVRALRAVSRETSYVLDRIFSCISLKRSDVSRPSSMSRRIAVTAPSNLTRLGPRLRGSEINELRRLVSKASLSVDRPSIHFSNTSARVLTGATTGRPPGATAIIKTDDGGRLLFTNSALCR
jgi:hypothetical protein